MHLKDITSYFEQLSLHAFSLKEFSRIFHSAYKQNMFTHYKHPLGFYFFNIASKDKTSLRLHVWPDDENERKPIPPDFPIHDHVWSFESKVLTGEVTNVIYELRESLNGDFYRLKTFYKDKGVELNSFEDSKFDLSVSHQQRVRIGEIYSLGSGIYHQTIAGSDITATLLKTTIELDREPYVLTRDKVVDLNNLVERRPRKKEYVDRLVEKFLEKIS